MRPPQIRATHLQRLALLYIRQSSPAQVRDHTGSAASQLDLKDLLLRWGWANDRIRVFDIDQGISASSGERRGGIDELIELLESEQVGIIMGRELARFARRPPDISRILWAVKTTGTLIWDQGAVKDPANESISELFGLQIKGLFGWVENETRALAVMAAKIAKARRGQAVTPPPTGYIRNTRGDWIKDENIDVQTALSRVFQLYDELRSLNKVVRELNRQDLRFPRRRRGELTWRGIDAVHLHSVLRNPAYVGDYVFKYKPLPGHGSSQDAPPNRERLVIQDHHEPYVDRATWQRIQEVLSAQRPTLRPITGKGSALLQGLLRCQCGRWLRTQYWTREGNARTAKYICRPKDEWGRELHRVMCPARLVDHAIVREVLQALRPAEMEHALAAVESARSMQKGIDQTHRRQLELAEHEVERTRAAYERASFTSSTHPRVQADLLDRYERALGDRDRLRESQASEPISPHLTPEESDELVALCSGVDRLWQAPTTTNQDRKRLLKTVISEIVVKDATRELVDVEIVWRGDVKQPLRVLRPRGVDALVRERTMSGKSAAGIVEELNAGGTLTGSGRPMSANVVSQKLGQHGLRLKNERIVARQIIREALLTNTPRPEILRQLQTQAPRLGPWDPQALSEAIRQMRRGATGVEPLPETLPADAERLRVLGFIEQQINAGKAWAEIARMLNAGGFRPPRGKAFTLVQVRSLYLRAHGLKSFRLPSKQTPR